MVGKAEICTECTINGGKGYVPINGICKAHDDAATTVAAGAGCLKEGDVAADATSTTCKKCSGANYFLFMGGCYKTGETPGTLICSAAAAGKCSTCVEGGNVFKNQTTGPTLGTECILCSDSKGSNDNKGALNCLPALHRARPQEQRLAQSVIRLSILKREHVSTQRRALELLSPKQILVLGISVSLVVALEVMEG